MARPIWQNAFPKAFLLREVSVQGCILLIITAIWSGLKPFVRRIQPEKWHNHRFPFAEQEQVLAPMATAIYLLLPLFNLGYFLFLMRRYTSGKTLFRKAVTYCLALFVALELTVLLCELIKRTYGRLRPDFLSRCFGVQDSATLMQISRSFTDDTPPDCSQSKYSAAVIEDGRMSFPSEHSATASAVCVFMALWDLAQVKDLFMFRAYWDLAQLKDETGVGELLVVPILILLPPLTISISRTSDYRHHATDVIFGILIGSLVTLGVFCTSFPRKRSKVQPIGMGPESWAFPHSESLEPSETLGDSQFLEPLANSEPLGPSAPCPPAATGTSLADSDSRLLSATRRR